MNKLAVVITLYQKKFNDTPSAKLLLEYAQANQILLIIFDNSKNQDLKIPEQTNVIYQWHPENEGISVAYNFALSEASKQAFDLLLLLDHDTAITANYLTFILNEDFNQVKAIVPQIISHEVTVSPLMADRYISLKNSQTLKSGMTKQPLMAINSGAVLPVAVLEQIGGFNNEFPLDFLDHWLFWRLNQLETAYLISDEQIQHELSVQTPQAMSTKRYQSIVTAEAHYYQSYNQIELQQYRKHLKLRMIKQFLTIKNRQLWRLSFRNLRLLRKG